MNPMFHDIPGSSTWKSIELISKGYSNDSKYHITTYSDEHFLLRIAKPENYDQKKDEFITIKKVFRKDFAMSEALDFGLCQAGVYLLLTWIEGDDLESALPALPLADQYRLGCEAGRILHEIHNTPFEFERVSWEERFNQKLDRKIKNYEACPLKYESGQFFVEYINQSRHLLKDRPNRLQHGDYHVGNLILTPSGQIGVIDFNRFDYGDPWEEFNRIVWDVRISPAFATGRVDGYFDHHVPECFFKLLALYIAANTLSSLPWAIPFGEGEITIMREQAKNILIDFHHFNRVFPKWYTDSKANLERLGRS